MAQRQPWFRARRGEQGTGYSLIHWKGAAAVVLIALFCSGLAALPALLLGGSEILWVVGLVLALPIFGVLLLMLVRAKAERWEG
jgi:hypothetical protein